MSLSTLHLDLTTKVEESINVSKKKGICVLKSGKLEPMAAGCWPFIFGLLKSNMEVRQDIPYFLTSKL